MVVKSSKLIESSDYVGGIICDYVECIIHAYYVAESFVTMLEFAGRKEMCPNEV